MNFSTALSIIFKVFATCRLVYVVQRWLTFFVPGSNIRKIYLLSPSLVAGFLCKYLSLHFGGTEDTLAICYVCR